MNIPGQIVTVIVDYNFIVNTDLGLMRFIRSQFQDPRAFNLDIVNKKDGELLTLLYSRIDKNPLSIISTEENMKDIDKLYESFFEEYKKEICGLSTTQKTIMKFIKMGLTIKPNSGIKMIIGVNDEFEYNDIERHFKTKSIVYNNTEPLKDYGAYYIKDFSYVEQYNLSSIQNKKFYIPPLEYNFLYLSDHKSFSKSNAIVMMGPDYAKLYTKEKTE